VTDLAGPIAAPIRRRRSTVDQYRAPAGSIRAVGARTHRPPADGMHRLSLPLELMGLSGRLDATVPHEAGRRTVLMVEWCLVLFGE
jgi:hypothetical protein